MARWSKRLNRFLTENRILSDRYEPLDIVRFEPHTRNEPEALGISRLTDPIQHSES